MTKEELVRELEEELTILKCDRKGPGHIFCGWCEKHKRPRIKCGGECKNV